MSESINLKTGWNSAARERFFQIPFWGHIIAANQDIVTKVGVCEDYGVL